jgi:DNA-directed RNA polymerase specialized sigma24 family protein
MPTRCTARIQAPLPLQLHDIDDAERFVGTIVSRSGFSLSFHDREDLGEYLLVECWQLSLRYQAGGISFSTWAGNTLRRRSVDWLRQQNGRTIWRFGDGRVHERPRREFVSFDDANARDRLDEALAEGNGDSEADRDEALGGLLDARDREADRDYAILGLEPPRRATG